MSDSRLAQELSLLRQDVRSRIDRPHPPQTTLEIIDERGREEFWERILAYFVDPSAPHGFGTDVLRSFLRALNEAPMSSLPRIRTGLDDVAVNTQVSAEDGNPDILLWRVDDWFILVEMKVRSGESNDQTDRYAISERFGPIAVPDYAQEDRHYVYLCEPDGSAPVASDTFDKVGWNQILPQLEAVIEDDRGQYPAKSRAQYIDFLDTIKTEFNMTEYDTDLRERAILNLEYEDTIDAVQGRLDQFIDQQADQWESEFYENIQRSQANEYWLTSQHGEYYLHVYRPDWTLDPESSTLGGEDGRRLALYLTPFKLDNIRNREIQVNFKITTKWIDDRLAQYIRSYMEEHIDQLQPQITDNGFRLASPGVSALFTRSVPYDIDKGHSVGEQVAKAIPDIDNELHVQISAQISEAVAAYQETQE